MNVTAHGKVIAFNPEDELLQQIFARQCAVSIRVEAMARDLYETRSLWIGGGTIPWSELSAPRKLAFRTEVENLVKKANGER